MADVFKVLGDPTRLRILRVLMNQEVCVRDIADELGMGQSAVSHQLRILRDARLVQFRRDGKTYTIRWPMPMSLRCSTSAWSMLPNKRGT